MLTESRSEDQILLHVPALTGIPAMASACAYRQLQSWRSVIERAVKDRGFQTARKCLHFFLGRIDSASWRDFKFPHGVKVVHK